MSDRVRTRSHCSIMLEQLSDGRRHSTVELNALGVGRPNSRSADLWKHHGFRVECVRVHGAEGANAYQYRLLSAPLAAGAIEEQLSPEARARLEGFRRETAPAVLVGSADADDPSVDPATERAPLFDTSSGSATAAVAFDQLGLDEALELENELSAIQSYGPPYTRDDQARIERLEGQLQQLGAGAS